MSFTIKFPPEGAGPTVLHVASFSDLPTTEDGAKDGDMALTLDLYELYALSSTGVWTLLGPSVSPDLSAFMKRDGTTPPTATMDWGNQAISNLDRAYGLSRLEFSGTVVTIGSATTGNGGPRSVYVGDAAGQSGGTQNSVMIGWQAGKNTSGGNDGNTFVGTSAGLNAGTLASNTYIGHTAGQNLLGTSNTAVGRGAGGGFSNPTSASANTFIGIGAGGSIKSTGSSTDFNTAIGNGAGALMDSCTNNVMLGRSAGDSTTTGSGNVVIGANTDTSAPSASNELVLSTYLTGTPASGLSLKNQAGTTMLSFSNAGAVTLGNGPTQTHRVNGLVQAPAAGVLTLVNAPGAATGDPTVYLTININGTDYVIPAWAF